MLTKEEIRDELLGALKEIVGGRTEIAEDDNLLALGHDSLSEALHLRGIRKAKESAGVSG